MITPPAALGPSAGAAAPLLPNVDAAELHKFADQAHTWWDENGEFAPLHRMNPVRLAWIETQAGTLAGRRVLDVGCGGGLLAEAMARRGADVLGIDLAPASVKVAQLHALEGAVPGLAYRVVAAEDLARESPGGFDVVTCMEMLEHVPRPAAVLQAVAALLRPGGHALFSTLNRNARSYALAIFGAEYLLNLVARGTHDWSRFIRPSELVTWAEDAGLEAAGLTGLHYNPLTRRFTTGGGVDVNYLLACRKPR